MTEHNRIESDKLNDSAKWVIRQLLLEIETQNTEIEKWRNESEIRTTNANAAMKEAEVYRGIAKEKSKRLEALKQTGDECEDIKHLIDSHRAS